MIVLDDARTWQLIDRDKPIGPMSTADVIDALYRGTINSSARCRLAATIGGTPAWTKVTDEPAFATWHDWSRGRWWLTLMTGIAALTAIAVLTAEAIPWGGAATLVGLIALELGFATYRMRRRAVEHPAGAVADMGAMLYALAMGTMTHTLKLLMSPMFGTTHPISLRGIMAAVAMSALACVPLMLHERRHRSAAKPGTSPA